MRLKLTLAVLILLAAPSWAAAAMYFEFNPDYAQSLLVASSETILEIFLPLNEHMSGIDFWLSNASTASDVTFVLLSQSGSQLSQRTVPLSPLADTPGGTRVHVNWGQMPVTTAAPYRVRITTSVPSVRLYYATTNRIITHNAPPEAYYSSGVASIGDEEREFSFKYALHENSESVAPLLSNVQVGQPAVGQAVITFNANEPVDAQVTHTTGSVPFTGQYTSCLAGMATCSVSLTVTPGIAHDYTLMVRDVWGNETLQTGSFAAIGTPPETTTPTSSSTPSPGASPTVTPTPPPDISPPAVSNLRAVNINTTGASIAWTTDEAANSFVVVQSLPFLINAGDGDDSTFELEHLIPITELDPDSSYLARITTNDLSGNSVIATVSFQTLPVTTTPPPGSPTPTPSGTPASTSTPTPTVSVGPSGDGNGQAAQWSPPGTPPSDGYRIDIIGADGKLIRTIRTNDTSVNLGDIPEGATVVVYADNAGVYEKVAAPANVHYVSFWERLLGWLPYLLGGLVAVIIAVIAIVKLRAPKKPKIEPSTPMPRTGAQPNPPSSMASGDVL